MKKDNKKRKGKNEVKKTIWVALLIALIAWAGFNPYYSFGLHWEESAYIDFLSNFARTINSACASANIGYRFLNDDILLLLRFIECTAFGVVCSNIFKYGRDGWRCGKEKTFWCFFIFVGLWLTVMLIYSGSDKVNFFHRSMIPLHFAYSIGFWSVCILSWLKSKDKMP